MPTAAQIAQVRQTPFSAGLIMAIADAHPLFNAFDFRTVDGYDFLSLALVSRPNAANFAKYGEGFEHTAAVYELRKFSTSLVGGIVKCECITEERWNRENSAIDWDWFDIETEEKFKESIMNIERQMILGRANNADGFPGAKELTPFISGNTITMTENGAKYGYVRSVLNAGGSTADTASSVYSFVFGEKDCQGILGGGATSGEFLRVDEPTIEMLAPDPVNAPTKLSRHRVAQMSGHVGMAVAGFSQETEGQTIPVQFGLRRLANLTEQTGYKLTDAHMTKLSRMHGTGKRPNLYAMSERSGEQLAASRAATAINFNMGIGDAATMQSNTFPDPPDNWRGTPIVYVDPDVIVDTDAIEV